MNNELNYIERILNGDYKLLIEKAEEEGKKLSRKISTSQIRNIYNTLKKIEAIGYNEETEGQLLLLKPKIAYISKRHKGAEEVRYIIEKSVDLIVNAEDSEKRFENFCKFFEAILAYHRAYGGK